MNLKNVLGATALAGVLALSGAAFAQTAAEKGQAAAKQQELVKNSTGHQEGNLLTIESGQLTLKPYQQASGVANLQVGDEVQVFARTPQAFLSSQLSSATLEPGSDVRVYFNQQDNQNKVVAIELLPPSAASSVYEGQKDKPKK